MLCYHVFVHITFITSQVCHQAFGSALDPHMRNHNKRVQFDPPSCESTILVWMVPAATWRQQWDAAPEPSPNSVTSVSEVTKKAKAWRYWSMSCKLYKVASSLDKKDKKMCLGLVKNVSKYSEILRGTMRVTGTKLRRKKRI